MGGRSLEELDRTQYSRRGIGKYEAVFGRHFVSTGGGTTSAEFLAWAGIGPGMRVLDIGSGLGGHAFRMALEFGATVDGVDVSGNMVEIARERCREEGLESKVRFTQGDVLTTALEGGYDAVHSRDAFLHVHDKPRLCAVVRRALKSGGIFAFTDYCRGEGRLSDAFEAYVRRRRYCLLPVADNRDHLERAGFAGVEAEDRTRQFIAILGRELESIDRSGLPPADVEELASGWRFKIDNAGRGEHRWGWFRARNP